MRILGEASAVVTCLDGYAIARKGARRGTRHCRFGPFIAGVIVTIALFVVGPAMSESHSRSDRRKHRPGPSRLLLVTQLSPARSLRGC